MRCIQDVINDNLYFAVVTAKQLMATSKTSVGSLTILRVAGRKMRAAGRKMRDAG
jgi:hypothetical protein